MYAIIKDSGSQLKVSKGDVILVDLREMPADSNSITFGEVLMIGGGDKTTLGAPTIPGAKVLGEVLGQIRDEKVTIFKLKRRKNYRRHKGHRQGYLRVRVTDIQG